jgi:hypothetical protein
MFYEGFILVNRFVFFSLGLRRFCVNGIGFSQAVGLAYDNATWPQAKEGADPARLRRGIGNKPHGLARIVAVAHSGVLW